MRPQWSFRLDELKNLLDGFSEVARNAQHGLASRLQNSFLNLCHISTAPMNAPRQIRLGNLPGDPAFSYFVRNHDPLSRTTAEGCQQIVDADAFLCLQFINTLLD